MEKVVLQVAEYNFNDFVKNFGKKLNNTLEVIPIVSTIKHIMRSRKVF